MIGKAPTCNATHCCLPGSMNETSMRIRHRVPVTTGLGSSYAWSSSGPGDVLIVWKLDRLGRSLPHLIEIVGGLRVRGVGFRSLTESIDTTTAMGEFLFHVFGALAQYERSLIRERVLAGLEAAKRRGRVGGRPRKLDAERIDAARSLMTNGMTVSAAARSVGVPRSTLVDSLRRKPPEQSDAESGSDSEW